MTTILFPTGRMVKGSLYKANVRTDNNNKPKANADGTPQTGFDFGVAYPKNGTTHWNQTEWGAKIHAEGVNAWGAQSQAPTFAWKVIDGDSVIPNKKNKRPCDQAGYAGHWVVWYSQGWAPQICNNDGKVILLEPDSVVPGYFVQVLADVKGNGVTNPSPGVFINPQAVSLQAYGERIVSASVDTAAAGFGGGALPAGASATPVGGMSTAQAGAYAPPAAPPPVAGTPVPPSQAFLGTPPPPPNAPAVPPPPPTGPVMRPAANGATYADMIRAGWTDATLREHGMMV